MGTVQRTFWLPFWIIWNLKRLLKIITNLTVLIYTKQLHGFYCQLIASREVMSSVEPRACKKGNEISNFLEHFELSYVIISIM